MELHIEQGPVLADAGAPLGVVSSIAGIVRCTRSSPAGRTTPGRRRWTSGEDALTAAAEYVLEVRDRAAEIDGAVATVGQLEVDPGAANVIPGSVS